ncbi:MAG: hypothetical protein Q4A01_02535 [Coriobacteriales bacterium]|nr:hypothetical protein [Coriobacteriales bacterium]
MGVNRIGKSILAALVTLTLVLGMVPATVFADSGEADVTAEPDATVQSETAVQPQTYVDPEASVESVGYLETAVEKNEYEPIEISSGFNVDVVADASLNGEAFVRSVNRFIDLADGGGSHAFFTKGTKNPCRKLGR